MLQPPFKSTPAAPEDIELVTKISVSYMAKLNIFLCIICAVEARSCAAYIQLHSIYIVSTDARMMRLCVPIILNDNRRDLRDCMTFYGHNGAGLFALITTKGRSMIV